MDQENVSSDSAKTEDIEKSRNKVSVSEELVNSEIEVSDIFEVFDGSGVPDLEFFLDEDICYVTDEDRTTILAISVRNGEVSVDQAITDISQEAELPTISPEEKSEWSIEELSENDIGEDGTETIVIEQQRGD